MGRANPFRELVAGLTADEFLLLIEAADERHRRDEVVVGTLAEAKASYRPDPRRPGVRRAAPGETGPPRPASRGGAAARTGSCCATPSRWTRPTSSTPTSPRAAGRPADAAYPSRSSVSASPSTCTRTRSRSHTVTGSPARRA